MKKKGFTLVELLAVIIILAVIALIATPIVLNVVESSREQGRLQSVNGLIKSAELYAAEAMLDENISLEGNLLEPVQERIDGRKPESGEILFDKETGKIAIAVKYDGYCYIKGFTVDEPYNDGTTEDCTIVEYVADTLYEIEVADTYDINYDVCMAVFASMSSDYTEEDMNSICTGGNASDGLSIDSALEKGWFSYQELEEMNVISNVVTKKENKSCYEYSQDIASFDINYDACYSALTSMGEMTEEDVISICTGGEDSTGMSLEDAINEYPEETYIYIDMGIIENVEYINEATITGYNCVADNIYGLPVVTDVVIPTKLNDAYVVAIKNNSFYNLGLTSVNFNGASKLKDIGYRAFYGNQISGKIDLSNTKLMTIDAWAFRDNQITNLKLPNSVEIIGASAFYGNQISGELDLSNTKIETIGNSSFNGNQITSVKLPSSVETIEQSVFCGNQISTVNLKELTNLETVDISAFEGNQISGELDLGNLTNLKYVSGFDSNEITSVKLPNGVETIGAHAFNGNRIVGELDLSNTKVTEIEYNAFSENQISSLKLPNVLETMSWGVFRNNELSGELDFSQATSLTTIGASAFASNKISGELDLTSLTNLKSISGFDNNQITSVKLPTSIEIIGESAFENNNVQNLELNGAKSLITIGRYAFGNNQISGELDFSQATLLTTIGSWAFQNNEISGELDLSNTKLTEIGLQAFLNNNIEKAKFPNSLETIGASAFFYNQIAGVLDLSNTKLMEVPLQTFRNNLITSVKLPDSIEIIGKSAFSWNEISDELDFSSFTNLKAIEGATFSNNQITSVKLPSSVEIIGEDTFGKSSSSNPNLVAIINPSGNVFDWSSITGSTTTGQSFATGTITHQNGDITVTAE